MAKKKALSLSALTKNVSIITPDPVTAFDVFKPYQPETPTTVEKTEIADTKLLKDISKDVVTELSSNSTESFERIESNVLEKPSIELTSGISTNQDLTDIEISSVRLLEQQILEGERKRTKDNSFEGILEREGERKGYVIVPDSLTFTINKYKIPLRAKTILNVLIRRCLGYKTTKVELGYSYFVKATGFQKANVAKAIKVLLERNLIKVENPVNVFTVGRTYELSFLQPYVDALVKNETSYKVAEKSNINSISKNDDIPDILYQFLIRKNLSSSEWEKAISLTTSKVRSIPAQDIMDVIDHVYDKGMVGGEFEGKRTSTPFSYLEKAFGFVYERVLKLRKKHEALIALSEREKLEAIERENIEEQKKLALLEFDIAFPTEDDKKYKLDQLLEKYKSQITTETGKEFASLAPKEVLIAKWYTGEL